MKYGNKKPQLNIVVALACEARVFIHTYQLKKNNTIRQIPFYQNQEKTISLIETGIGKIKSAAGTAFFQAITNNELHTCYLNLGVAGSISHAIGEIALINKIQDEQIKKNWYPLTLSIPTISQTNLFTVDVPKSDYPSIGMIDMEGSGYFQAANQFISKEQIQLLKIVSDNSKKDQTHVTPKMVDSLVHENLSAIDQVVNALLEISSNELVQTNVPLEIEPFLRTWHFTHYQQRELSELLRRWHINRPKEAPFDLCKKLESSKKVLRELTENLDQFSYSWE